MFSKVVKRACVRRRKGSYSHSTFETAWLWAAAVGMRLLGNDERLFTGVGVQTVHRVIGVVGQGAAIPHRGLSYIHDLITHCLLVVVVKGEVIREKQTAARPPSREGGRG